MGVDSDAEAKVVPAEWTRYQGSEAETCQHGKGGWKTATPCAGHHTISGGNVKKNLNIIGDFVHHKKRLSESFIFRKVIENPEILPGGEREGNGQGLSNSPEVRKTTQAVGI